MQYIYTPVRVAVQWDTWCLRKSFQANFYFLKQCGAVPGPDSELVMVVVNKVNRIALMDSHRMSGTSSG